MWRPSGARAENHLCLLHFHVVRHGSERQNPPFRGQAYGGGRGRKCARWNEVVGVDHVLPQVESALLPVRCFDVLELAGRLCPRNA